MNLNRRFRPETGTSPAWGQVYVTLIYLKWIARQIRSFSLPRRNESVQPTIPQPKKILSKVEILKQEFQIKKEKLSQENQKLKEKVEERKFRVETNKVMIKKITKERDTFISDLKYLNLDNKRLRDELKDESKHPQKKARVFKKNRKEIGLWKELEYWKQRAKDNEAESIEQSQKVVRLRVKLKDEKKRSIDS